MASSRSLFIKYGLRHVPDEDEVKRWLELTETLILSGIEEEEAGLEAAKQTFQDFNSVFYASQADTIEALLAAARNRNDQNGNG